MKFKFPSRNRKVEHENKFNCPYCNQSLIKDKLPSDHIIKYLNEEIVECPYCNQQFIPNVTIDIKYIYSGHCKTKDKLKK